MIKRYDHEYYQGTSVCDMVEKEDGEWVRWDDVKKAVEKQTAKPTEHAKGTHGVGYEYDAYVCPICRVPLEILNDYYCANCGQKLEV